MERIDPGKAAAVWQRVHASPPPRQENRNLPALIAQEMEDAAQLQQLARHFPDTQESLRQVIQRCRSRAACLKGIHFLTTGNRPAPCIPKITPRPPEIVLRQCYGNALARLSQYDSHSTDPEYGQVFSQLVTQTQSHCHFLLEMLGNLKK